LEESLIFKTIITTAIGNMVVCANKEGICLLEFEDRPDINRQLMSLLSFLEGTIVPGTNTHILNLQSQIDLYFKKELKKFDLPLVFAGTDFQKSVWNQLLYIPFGSTQTYLAVTKKLGNVKAIRAVASANGANKIAILVPCHRVIGSDGSLIGYAGGLWRKKWLLEHESAQVKMDF